MLAITRAKELLFEMNIKLLADKGYHHTHLITPTVQQAATWNNTQKGLRSIVERVFGYNILWRFNATKVKLCPELQELGILITYQLTNMMLLKYPLS